MASQFSGEKVEKNKDFELRFLTNLVQINGKNNKKENVKLFPKMSKRINLMKSPKWVTELSIIAFNIFGVQEVFFCPHSFFFYFRSFFNLPIYVDIFYESN